MGRPKKLNLEIKKPRRKKPILLAEGMTDILPEDQKYWDFVLEKFTKIIKPYSFSKIDTPLLEKSELFSKRVGFSENFVSKNMFIFKDIKKENLALKYDLIMSVARAYVEKNMYSLGRSVKLYSYGPVFRNKNYEENSLKQNFQFSMNIIGKDDAAVDAQVIFLIKKMLESVGLRDLEVQVNSTGCSLCAYEYKSILTDFINSRKSRLCNSCKKSVKENIFSIFNCQNEDCRSIFEDAPEVIDSLCESCKNHFKIILEYLDDLKIPYNLNSRIFKKINYYTKTAFEITAPKKEKNGVYLLAEGGRHDDLIDALGGNSAPMMSSSLDLNKIIDLIKEQEIKVPEKKIKPDVLLIQLGELAKRKALEIFDDMINKGINVKESLHKDSIKSQLRLAKNLEVKFAVILGQKEVLDKTVLIRDMESGIQEIINLEKLVEELKKRLKNYKKNN
jgi:histidyl-tRNA synthetase